MNGQLPDSSDDSCISLLDENIAVVCRTLSGLHLSPLHTDVIGEALEKFFATTGRNVTEVSSLLILRSHDWPLSYWTLILRTVMIWSIWPPVQGDSYWPPLIILGSD